MVVVMTDKGEFIGKSGGASEWQEVEDYLGETAERREQVVEESVAEWQAETREIDARVGAEAARIVDLIREKEGGENIIWPMSISLHMIERGGYDKGVYDRAMKIVEENGEWVSTDGGGDEVATSVEEETAGERERKGEDLIKQLDGFDLTEGERAPLMEEVRSKMDEWSPQIWEDDDTHINWKIRDGKPVGLAYSDHWYPRRR